MACLITQHSFGDAKSYIIISQLPDDVYRKYVENKDKFHMTGFTFVVIAVVHLAGGRITEENLWHQLRRVGVLESDENHPLFGNSKVALETLFQQRYLQKDKVKGPEGTTLYFELAERSLDAAMSDKIKQYISQVMLNHLKGVMFLLNYRCLSFLILSIVVNMFALKVGACPIAL
ncbi:hypothetical protein Leryth_024963 [Lithospermum erythrorhizon]|nr:hypothetical protein Leryth_024963 [Lithospermum erythrorhizon]